MFVEVLAGFGRPAGDYKVVSGSRPKFRPEMSVQGAVALHQFMASAVPA